MWKRWVGLEGEYELGGHDYEQRVLEDGEATPSDAPALRPPPTSSPFLAAA